MEVAQALEFLAYGRSVKNERIDFLVQCGNGFCFVHIVDYPYTLP